MFFCQWHVRKNESCYTHTHAMFPWQHVDTLPKFNITLPKRKVVFQPPFFRGYVKLGGCRGEVNFKGSDWHFTVREDFKERRRVRLFSMSFLVFCPCQQCTVHPSYYRHGCFTKTRQIPNKANNNAALHNNIICKNLCFSNFGFQSKNHGFSHGVLTRNSPSQTCWKSKQGWRKWGGVAIGQYLGQHLNNNSWPVNTAPKLGWKFLLVMAFMDAVHGEIIMFKPAFGRIWTLLFSKHLKQIQAR